MYEETGLQPARAGTGTGTERAGEDAIQAAEEELRVGKREVGRGGVRVRSYVTERPVEEQVELRQERVSVERRHTAGTLVWISRATSGWSAISDGGSERQIIVQVSTAVFLDDLASDALLPGGLALAPWRHVAGARTGAGRRWRIGEAARLVALLRAFSGRSKASA